MGGRRTTTYCLLGSLATVTRTAWPNEPFPSTLTRLYFSMARVGCVCSSGAARLVSSDYLSSPRRGAWYERRVRVADEPEAGF